jgi:ribosomal protein S18 acetylase RimI-like enzyme
MEPECQRLRLEMTLEVSTNSDSSPPGPSFLIPLFGDPGSLNLAIMVAAIQANGSLAGWLTAARLLVEVRKDGASSPAVPWVRSPISGSDPWHTSSMLPSWQALTSDDWPLWREVRLAALAEAPYAFKSRLEDWQKGGEQRWRSRLETPGTYNIVAMLDGQPVGMASGIPGDKDVSELRSVWVSPPARGRGVGDRLVAAVEVWAKESGAKALKLAVIPGNEPAIALYRRNGFVIAGEVGGLLSDGVTREQVMVKALR